MISPDDWEDKLEEGSKLEDKLMEVLEEFDTTVGITLCVLTKIAALFIVGDLRPKEEKDLLYLKYIKALDYFILSQTKFLMKDGSASEN